MRQSAARAATKPAIAAAASATLAALVALSPATWAQQPPAATEHSYITAFSCTRLPAPLTVEVVTFDDSDPALKLHGALLRELRDRRIAVDPKAALRLSIDMHVSFERARQRRPDLVTLSRREPEFERSTLHEGFETRAEVNVWSSRSDSLVGGRRPTVIGKNLEQLRVVLAVHDKANGRCLWQGEAVRDLDGRDRWAEAARVLPALVRSIGTAAARKPLVVD